MKWPVRKKHMKWAICDGVKMTYVNGEIDKDKVSEICYMFGWYKPGTKLNFIKLTSEEFEFSFNHRNKVIDAKNSLWQ